MAVDLRYGAEAGPQEAILGKRRKTVLGWTGWLLLLLASALFTLALSSPAQATSSSSNVLLVPDEDGSSAYGGDNGGSFPLSGFPNGYSPTFNNATPEEIADGTGPNPIDGNDTVVLVQICNIDTFLSNPVFKSRIEAFVGAGGKLIIWDSECAGSDRPDYSKFVFPFTSNNPGAGGSECSPETQANCFLDDVESNSLGTDDDPSSPLFTDTTKIANDTDAVGDSNVFTTQDPAWCVDMVANNVNEEGGGKLGPVQAYARLGAGLIIYDGLDMDDIGNTFDNSTGEGAYSLIWLHQLMQPFNPDDLPCGVVATGITLSPSSATNTIGQSHTVTATVRDDLGDPIEGVEVTFTITSGPNTGTTGTGTTDANGQATFSYTSSVTGTDKIQASFDATPPDCVPEELRQDLCKDTRQSNVVTKTWVAPVAGNAQAAKALAGKAPVKPAASASIHGPRRCTRTTATARVSGQNIASVTYSLDGKKVKTVKGRNKSSVTVNARHLKSGVHRITARITFTAATAAKATTKRITFQRCARKAVKPKFTG